MYRWKLRMILKSGKELIAYYKGDENNSTDVADNLFAGEGNNIIGFYNEDETENILVLRKEIAAMGISVG